MRRLIIACRRALLGLSVALGISAAFGVPAASALEVGIVGGPNPQLWPVFIGNKYKFFGVAGQLDLVTAPSSSAIVQQVAAGSLPMSVSSGLTDPIRAATMGADVAIARIDGEVPPYALLAKPGIHSLAELRGKIISIGGAKDITRVYLEKMLAPSSVLPGQYDLVFAGATSARFAALSAGAVDAALLFPPFNFRAVASGYRQLGLVVDFAPDLPFSGVTANRAWARANPAVLRAVLDGYDRAVGWMRDPGHRDEAIAMMVAATHSDITDITQTFDFLGQIGFYSERSSISRRKLSAMIDALAAQGDIPAGTTIERLVLPGTVLVP